MRLVLATFLTLISGCAATTVNHDVARIEQYLKSLPSCASGLAAQPVDALSEPNPHAVVRGTLVRAGAICTLLFCPHRACCNGCGGRWVLTGSASTPPLTLLQPDGTLLGWGAMDCSLKQLDHAILPVAAIAAGALRPRTADYDGAHEHPFELVVTELCLVR